MSNKKPVQKQKMSEGTQALIVCLVAVAVMIIALVIVMVATIQEDATSSSANKGTSAATQATTMAPGVDVDMDEVEAEIDSMSLEDFTEVDEKTEYVKLTVKDMGDIVIRLRSDVAPLTVKNFQKLVDEDFYTGTIFHRVIQDFMIQGGSGEYVDKTASQVKGEFTNNKVENNLKHIRGVISMARVSGQNNSASSQFFICDATNDRLDGDYATFGYVVVGMDVVDAIAAVECDTTDPNSPRPYDDIVVEKACFVKPVTTSAETTVDTTVDTTVETTIETTVETTVDPEA